MISAPPLLIGNCPETELPPLQSYPLLAETNPLFENVVDEIFSYIDGLNTEGTTYHIFDIPPGKETDTHHYIQLQPDNYDQEGGLCYTIRICEHVDIPDMVSSNEYLICPSTPTILEITRDGHLLFGQAYANHLGLKSIITFPINRTPYNDVNRLGILYGSEDEYPEFNEGLISDMYIYNPCDINYNTGMIIFGGKLVHINELLKRSLGIA